jgi:Holliday junction resolvase RusA-like endonuclease
MELTLDTKPLSINKAWRGGARYRTKDYLQYEKDVLRLLPKNVKIKGEFEIDITFYCKNYSRSDLDNIVKPILDILTKSNIIEDDRKCVRLQVFKEKSPKDYLEIDITPLE